MALFACKIGGSEGGNIDVSTGVDISSNFTYTAGTNASLSCNTDLSNYKLIALTVYCTGATSLTPSTNRTVSAESGCKAGLSVQKKVTAQDSQRYCYLRNIILTDIDGTNISVAWSDSGASIGASVVAVGYTQ